MTKDELEGTLLQDIQSAALRVRRILDDLQEAVGDAQTMVRSIHFGADAGLETIRGVERSQGLFLKAAGLNAAATEVGGLVETLSLIRQLEPKEDRCASPGSAKGAGSEASTTRVGA